jgi:hypothetical protein
MTCHAIDGEVDQLNIATPTGVPYRLRGLWSLLPSFRFVSKQSETIMLLKTLTKMPVVSSFHCFLGVVAGNFKFEPGNQIEIREALLRKTVKR